MKKEEKIKAWAIINKEKISLYNLVEGKIYLIAPDKKEAEELKTKEEKIVPVEIKRLK